MTTYRTGFGTGNYGVRVFGLDGAITDAISLVETAATTVTSAELIQQASATGTATSASTGSSEKIYQASASVSSSSSASGSAQYVYQSSGTSDAVSTNTASLQFITKAESHITASAGTSSVCDRIRFTDATVVSTVTFDANGQGTFGGALVCDTISTTSSSCERIALSGSSVGANLVFVANGLYKYEPVAKDNETWAVVPKNNETWTEVA